MVLIQVSSINQFVRHCGWDMLPKSLAANKGAALYRTHSPSFSYHHHHRRPSTTAATASVEERTTNPVNPDELFDQVDVDKDGRINRCEFHMALQLAKFDDVMTAQAVAKDNLERLVEKMEDVEKLQQNMDEMEANYYCGKKTASEIDTIYADSTNLKEDKLQKSIHQLKNLIYDARAIFSHTATTKHN